LIGSRANLAIGAPAQPQYLPPPAPADEESSTGGISLAQASCILRAYWKHSLVTLLVLTSVAAVAIKLMPKIYVATATLIVNRENKDPLAGRDLPTVDGGTYIPTQIELIMSRSVLEPVVDRLNLGADKEFSRGYVGPPAALKEVVTKYLRAALEVQQGAGSQLLYITASSHRPGEAADIANAVTDEYLKQNRQRTNDPAGERAQRYSKELLELRDKAAAAQDRLTEFRQQHGMTEVEGATFDQEGAALADLQNKLLDAQNQRRQLEAHQLDANASSDAALDSPAVQALRGKLAVQEAEMAELRTTLGPKHPKVMELQSEMDATRRSLAKEVESISANGSVQLTRARELEAKYQNAVNTERARLLERRAIQDQSSKLLLEQQSAQATYKKALDGYDQIVFASVGNYSDVTLVSRALVPVKSDKPNKFKFFLMACMASLGLSLAWPFAYELLVNRRLRCRDDLERHFKIPVLAQFGLIARTAG
jgi:polysaccharide biosynthesis transport protein